MLNTIRCLCFALGLLQSLWGAEAIIALPAALALTLCIGRRWSPSALLAAVIGFGLGEAVWAQHSETPPPEHLRVTVARDTVHPDQAVALSSEYGRLRWARPGRRLCAGTVLRLKTRYGAAIPGAVHGQNAPYRRALARGEVARLRAPRLLTIEAQPGPLRRFGCQLRQGAADALRQQLEPRLQPLAMALFMGERGFGDRQDAESLRQLGLAHLLAVSGLHVGLALAALLGLLRLVPLLSPRLRAVGWHQRLLAVLTCAAVCWWCAWPVGGQRLLTWAVLNLIAPHRPLRITGWASLALTLLIAPNRAADLGFLLSHSISMALVELLQHWRGGLAVPTVASITTALPLALVGLPSPWVSIAANTVFVPLFLPCFAVAGLCLAFGAGGPAEFLLRAYVDLCATVADSFGAHQLSLHLSVTSACAIAVAVAALLQRRWRAALVAAAIGSIAAPIDPGAQVWMLPVGHGDAVWVRSETASVVIDTGPSPHRLRSALLPLLPGPPDLLIISHADHDHVGGVAALCGTDSPDLAWSQTPLPQGCPRRVPPNPSSIGDMLLTPLAPADDWVKGRNDRSLIVRLETEGHRLLLLGDIGLDREDDLAGHFGRADLVKVPHHGSRTSSGAAIIAELGAREALIGAGPWDRFGHPHREVLQRWRAAGAAVHVADWRPVCRSLRMGLEPRSCVQTRFLRRSPRANLHPGAPQRRLRP